MWRDNAYRRLGRTRKRQRPRISQTPKAMLGARAAFRFGYDIQEPRAARPSPPIRPRHIAAALCEDRNPRNRKAAISKMRLWGFGRILKILRLISGVTKEIQNGKGRRQRQRSQGADSKAHPKRQIRKGKGSR